MVDHEPLQASFLIRHAAWRARLYPLLLTTGILLLPGLQMEAALAQPAYQVEALSPSDETYLDAQRKRVRTMLKQRLGAKLSGQRDTDFAVIQQLLDSGSLQADQTASLQAIDVLLGDYLADALGMVWVVAYSDNGRARALASPSGQLLYPVGITARLAETGQRVDIAQLYGLLLQQGGGGR